MLPDRVSNPGPLTYESGALPIALRARRLATVSEYVCVLASEHRHDRMMLNINWWLAWSVEIKFPHVNNTVNPLYNDIRYNTKIRYNVNLVCTKISGSCIFFINISMLFSNKTYVLCIC